MGISNKIYRQFAHSLSMRWQYFILILMAIRAFQCGTEWMILQIVENHSLTAPSSSLVLAVCNEICLKSSKKWRSGWWKLGYIKLQSLASRWIITLNKKNTQYLSELLGLISEGKIQPQMKAIMSSAKSRNENDAIALCCQKLSIPSLLSHRNLKLQI